MHNGSEAFDTWNASIQFNEEYSGRSGSSNDDDTVTIKS